MKKILSIVLSVLLIVFMFIPVFAVYEKTENVYFDDGSYIKVDFGTVPGNEVDDNQESEETDSFFQRLINLFKKILTLLFGKNQKDEAETIVKTKYAAYYDSQDNLLWTVYLTAEFSYDGEKSECISVKTSSSIKDSDWKLLSSEGEKNGNCAKGTFSVRQYKLGVPLKTVEKILTLSCDKNGNIK